MDIKNKRPSCLNLLKARIGRYYKIIKPIFRVLSGRSLEGKSTAFVIQASKKEQRKFFKARVYNLAQLVNKVRNSSASDLQKDEIREMLETLPLLLFNIAITREKWYIGKIDDQPFDIFIAPERLVRIEGKGVDIYRGLHIQTKRLYQHPPKQMTLEEWINFLQSKIEEKITGIDFGFNGHFHFYNLIPFRESVDKDKLKLLLKKLYVPFNKNLDSISLSLEVTDFLKGENTLVTYMIYPMVNSNFVGMLNRDLAITKMVYMEEDIAEMILKALKSKDSK